MALFPLNIMVEILINGTFRDISTFVYQRDGIVITGGSQDKTPHEKPQPSQATFTLDNRDFRFTPNNTGSPYYPYLKRNVQVRISVVNATSSSGNTYTGYRFWGEIRDWPPRSDVSVHDIYVPITANGPLRRLTTHGGKGSALARYYASLTGSLAPIAYWPCEEDPDTTQVQAGLSGGSNMDVVGTPRWKAISHFNGSHPIGVMNKSKWTGLTGSFATSGNDLYTAPGDYDWVASTTSVDARGWGSGAGGGNGGNGAAGGGGEFAKNATLAVVIGNTYRLHVPAGGAGAPSGSTSAAGDNGADATITDLSSGAVLLRAHGGSKSSGSTGGAGGTGSTDPTHFNGGAGGSNPSNFRSGAGGGSSAGTAAAGGNGANPTNDTTGNGAGGTPPAGAGGGGDGGKGHGSGNPADEGENGTAPGGGGGGGGDNEFGGFNHAGGNGAAGQIQMVYTPQTQATQNVLRFILFIPKHQGNSGKVLARFVTGSTKIATVDVTFVTGSGGKLRVQGFDNGAVQSFDSGAQAWSVQGRTLMVSVELKNSGANVAWAFKAIEPGNKNLVGSTSGTVTTASCGNVSQVIVGPNQDITKTAMGHFSVQYSLVSLRKLSRALHGHHEEIGIHRFIRLLNEEAMGNEPGYSETNDHWGFETGTQSWVATNGALTNPTTSFLTPLVDDNFVLKQSGATWPTDGTHSLLLTANGAGSPSAHSPSGTSGENILPGDRVSVATHCYTPTAIANMYIGIQFYTAAGATVGAESDEADYSSAAGEIFTMTHHATAPATAAFFAVFVGNHGTLSNGTLLYFDDVTVHPKFGPQTRKKIHNFLHEIKELDQGIMRESRKLWGLGYRTRFSLLNQSPAVTLSYTSGALSDGFDPVEIPDPAQGRHPHLKRIHGHMVGPKHHRHWRKGYFRLVFDEHNIKNDITVRRHKGSKVRVTLDSGTMSVQEPPAGTGRHRHRLNVAAHADEQLLALATHLLNLGTTTDERYPSITVNLGRAGITGNALAPLMSACAGVECGDYVQLTNLPSWFPSATAKQLVIGYTERLNPFEWQISWNCTPESPWEITATNIRRW